MSTIKPSQKEVIDPSQCPVCDRPLPSRVPPARCPYCLLRQGLPTQPHDVPVDTVVVPETNPSRDLPEPGTTFGHYRIVRLLGEGGMGAVFEAEDLTSGRRVALKVLGHRIDSPEARHRFFREGRLAASVNHPNSVYVFGTEEIAGVPVIAMELVSGGTLQDRVSRQGPMPVGEVVDNVLQIIAGLEAAQSVGVLHRDIKPSNCFVETDGTIKIGDFGLSISTIVRAEPALTATGTFMGTPVFSSPEQLRGDELTVRSDIYSVGVTLYYLLTAHYPFEAPDLVRLLATVLERRAESPDKRRPGLPSGLCRVVLRCLEKDPEKRFRTYDGLRKALLPYASVAPTPATLSLRFVAGWLDNLILALPIVPIEMFIRGVGQTGLPTTRHLLLINLFSTVLVLIYYGLLEGLWGASIGKLICQLRVARLDRTAPGIPRALLRAFILKTIPHLVWLMGSLTGLTLMSGAVPNPWGTAFSLLNGLTWALIFVSARRHNGFAGLHDLATSTRVIVKSVYLSRPALSASNEALPKLETLPRVGLYHVLDCLGREEGVELLLGFDARLLRRVWIRKLPPGTAPIPATLRQLGRPGRLRWLSAQRTDTEAWDAYEAASGQPLLALITKAQAWSHVRYWLWDLAEELDKAIQNGSMPASLALDRIWITAEGRAKLLDFPAPGTADLQTNQSPQPTASGLTPQSFLRQVALAALDGCPMTLEATFNLPPRRPLALHASQFLKILTPNTPLSDLIAALRALLGLRAQITRPLRAALLAGVMLFPLLAAMVGGPILKGNFLGAAEKAALRWYLTQHQQFEAKLPAGDSDMRADLEAVETYIAGRFGPLITNLNQKNREEVRNLYPEALQANAIRIIHQRANPSPEAFAQASARVKRLFPTSPDATPHGPIQFRALPFAAALVGYYIAVCFIIPACLIASLLFRGGALVKSLGVVFVNRTGQLASRWRVTARNLVAWLPFMLQPLGVLILSPWTGPLTALYLVLSSCAVLALISVLLPQRGLADRIVGTWPVPR
jgi:eukaryotic-like serine/threonine-protein kinase